MCWRYLDFGHGISNNVAKCENMSEVLYIYFDLLFTAVGQTTIICIPDRANISKRIRIVCIHVINHTGIKLRHGYTLCPCSA